jgi:hypothetical protein
MIVHVSVGVWERKYMCGVGGKCTRVGVWGSAVPLDGMGAAGCLYVRDRTTGYSTSGRCIGAGPIHFTGFKAQVLPLERGLLRWVLQSPLLLPAKHTLPLPTAIHRTIPYRK